MDNKTGTHEAGDKERGLVHPQPHRRLRRDPMSVLPALCRLTIHLASESESATLEHEADMHIIEAWLGVSRG